MVQFLLIGILGIAVIVLAVLFSKEKTNSRERENTLTEALTASIEQFHQAQQESLEAISKSLTDGLKSVDDSINSVKEETDKRIHATDRALQESVEENKRLVAESNSEINRKIDLLVTAFEQINKENAELKKKLEFFTEIGEDSKNINETEDVEQRDELIRKALSELSQKSTVTEKLDKKESKPEKTDIGHVEDVSDIKTSHADGILDDEQRTAFRIMNDTNENLFITGKAGTGKSFLLEMFVKGTNKDVIVLAPTGIAALNVNGATIHSTFGYSNLEEMEVEQRNNWDCTFSV